MHHCRRYVSTFSQSDFFFCCSSTTKSSSVYLFFLMFCKMQRSTKRQCRPAALLIGRHAQQAGGIQCRELGEQRRCRLGHAHPHPTLAAPDNPAPGCTCTSACKTPPSVAHSGTSLGSSPFSTSSLLPSIHCKTTHKTLRMVFFFQYKHAQNGSLVGEGEHPVLKVLIQFNGN